MKVLAGTVTSMDDIKIVNDTFRRRLIMAGDKHSFFMSKEETSREALENTGIESPQSRYLSNGIGYLKVPAMSTSNKKIQIDFASVIQTQIRQLDSANNIQGWVVDLRQNTGGIMWPMIEGLGPMLGNGLFEVFCSPTHKCIEYFYNDGNVGRHTDIKLESNYQLKNSETKIAVLIDSLTASSGEMTTIAFIGKKNVKLLGQPSAGYTTVNRTFVLSDGSLLNLAAAYVTDRNGKKYPDRIFPDVLIDTDTIEGKDNVIDAATAWLLSQ